MVYWLTENSTIPMVTGAILTLIFMGLAFSSREKVMVYIALGVGVLTFFTVLCERLYVTEQEEITSVLYELAQYVETNNTQAILDRVADGADDIKRRVESDMGQATFESCRSIGTNYFVGTESGNGQAEICFAVSARGSLRGDMGGSSFGQFKINVFFKRGSNGVWKIVDYKVDSPLAGVTL